MMGVKNQNLFKGASGDRSKHKILLATAKEQGIDVELLRTILWQIIAPDNLVGLPTAFRTIHRILEIAPNTWQADLHETGISEWKPTLEWVIQNEDQLIELIGPEFGKVTNTTGKNLLRGSGVTEYPYYAVLCEIHPHHHKDQFVLLVGQFLIANVIALKDLSSLLAYETATERPWKALENGVDGAARAVRRYAEEPKTDADIEKQEQNQSLGELPVQVAPEHFADELEDMAIHSNAQIEEDNFNLIRFFKKAYGDIEWVRRSSGGGGGGRGGGDWVGGSVDIQSPITIDRLRFDDGEDPNHNWGEIEVVTPKTQSKRERKKIIDSDLSPDEDDADEYAVISPVDCQDAKKGLGTLTRAAHAKMMKLEKQNQNIPWDYKGLAIEEMARLRKHIFEQLGKLGKVQHWGKEEQLQAEGLFVLHIMLWTGALAKDAVSIRMHGTPSQSTRDKVSIYWDPQKSQFCWEIPAITPPYETEVATTAGQVRTLAPYFYLPALDGLKHVLWKIMAGRLDAQRDIRVCLHTDTQILACIDRRLADFSPDRRITKDKISNALWEQLVLRYGDSTIASCITGRKHHLSKVRIFYTSPSIAKLQQAYLSVVEEVNIQIQKAAGRPVALPKLWMPSQDKQESCVGARMCPTVEAVKALFANLKTDLKSARNYADWDGFIQFHNLYTLYALQFLAYSTTYRAIKTPYLAMSQIEATRQIAAITDKDDGSHHKSRLVWLPKNLVTQMQAYESHRTALMQSQPQLAKGRVSNAPCFFLDEEGMAIEARPATIEPLLQKYLNVKANSHRRFLRTELVERGCMPEAIDACMGHWIAGEEPHGVFSSFHFGDYVEHLKTHLQQLHQNIGLQTVIHSPLVQ